MRMKKVLLLFLSAIICIVMLSACDNDEGKKEDVFYNVTYDYNGAGENKTVSVKAGSSLSVPPSPEREGYIFVSWQHYDEGKLVDWSFSFNIVNSDTTLIAKWANAATVFKNNVNEDGTLTITGCNMLLEDIRIPSVISGKTVSAIGERAFASLESESVSSISLPSTVVSVKNEAFLDCEEIEIICGGELIYVGDSAFANCTGLSKITFGEGLSQVGYRAFYNCTSLGTVHFPASLKRISENAFEGCTELKTVLVRSEELAVEDYAFHNCPIVTAFYQGNADGWSGAVIFENGNEKLRDAKLYFYSEAEPQDEGKYWYFDKNGNPRCW